MVQEEKIKDRIAGAIAGMVLGDAMGVPGELWPRSKVRERFGVINEFLDGPQDNIVACYFKKAQYTDDSAQAFVVLNALLKHGRVPAPAVLARDLLDWVESVNGFEINLLGPSSKASLLAWSKGEDAEPVTKQSLTNGAAMRIAPVGTLVDASKTELLVETVAAVSSVTHATDVAVSGAAAVAQAVASAVSGRSWDEMKSDVVKAARLGHAAGSPTWAARIDRRFELALKELDAIEDEEEKSLFIYEVLGTGTMTSESIPAALASAWACRTPEKAALFCANMGGDTDTIGCMASAICGAKVGLSSIRKDWIETLEKVNGISFLEIAEKIIEARREFPNG